MLAARSRLLLPLVLLTFVCAPAYASTLVDINTADDATLETLPGIGPTKANAIVAYRSTHGPFARTQDIQNVSGIGAATYANIASLITVVSSKPETTASSSASSTPVNSSSGGAQTYTPPPSQLHVDAGGDEEAFLNVPISFSAQARTSSGAVDHEARVTWSFGDGSTAEGSVVSKTYAYPGTYVVEVSALDGDTKAADDFVVTVSSAQVRIVDETSAGVVVANDSSSRLDLSNWHLWAGSGSFRVPQGTVILPDTSVLFPTSVTNLPVAFDARLYYPNGLLAAELRPQAPSSLTVSAASSTPAAVATVQPRPTTTRLYKKQTADSAAFSTVSENPAHAAQAVSAPAAATSVAAAGALYASSTTLAAPTAAAVARRPHGGLLSSPWTYGFVGVVAVAAGALVLL